MEEGFVVAVASWALGDTGSFAKVMHNGQPAMEDFHGAGLFGPLLFASNAADNIEVNEGQCFVTPSMALFAVLLYYRCATCEVYVFVVI
jgi:hypothetical protein